MEWDGEALSGRVVFYFQCRNDDDEWRIERENTEPLIDPRFDGRTLTFHVSHEDAHPGVSGPDDPPVRYELTLTGSNEGILRSTNDASDTETVMARVE